MSFAHRVLLFPAALLLAALAIVARPAPTGAAPNAVGDRDPSGARCVAIVEGLELPESALWDARRASFLVSEIMGGPTARDNNGRIQVVDREGRRAGAALVQGGRGNATLNAPKGMVIHGDTLWVADIDVVRAFDRRTGERLGAIELGPRGAVFLNDLERTPDGALWITDTGLAFEGGGGPRRAGPDRVWRIGPSREISVALESDTLGWLNGIAWDARADRFVLLPLNGRRVLGWSPGSAPEALANGPGGYDGVELLPAGEMLVSSQDGGGLFLVRGGAMVRLVGGIGAIANHGWDPRSRRVALPDLDRHRVEIWELPRRWVR